MIVVLLFATVLATSPTEDQEVYRASHTREGCQYAAFSWVTKLVESGVSPQWTALLSGPASAQARTAARQTRTHYEPDTPMTAFYRHHILSSMESYDVVQTGANTFTFSCRFIDWTHDLPNPWTELVPLTRYRMRCFGYQPGRWHRTYGEYFGRIDENGRGTCDLIWPLPEWRWEYLQELERAKLIGEVIADRGEQAQQEVIDELRASFDIDLNTLPRTSYSVNP